MNVTKILTEKMFTEDFRAREKALEEVCSLIINDKITDEGKLLVLDYSLKILFVDIGRDKNCHIRATNLCVIQCILEDNCEKDYILDDKLDEIYSVMIEYVSLEKVEFGYVEEIGMVHTLAHIADIFTTFFTYGRFCNMNRFKVYFELISTKYFSNNYVFITDEAARIFRIFNYFYIDSSNVEFIIEFLEDYKKTFKKGIEGLNQRQNYYNYLHVLHFFTNDMELLRFIVSQLEGKYKRYIDGIL